MEVGLSFSFHLGGCAGNFIPKHKTKGISSYDRKTHDDNARESENNEKRIWEGAKEKQPFCFSFLCLLPAFAPSLLIP